MAVAYKDLEQIRLLSKVYAPDDNVCAEIIRRITEFHELSIAHLSELTCLPTTLLYSLKQGQKSRRVSRVEKRVLWCLYQSHTNLMGLARLEFWASWGRDSHINFLDHPPSLADKKRMIAEMETREKGMSAYDVACYFGVTELVARKVCKLAHYRVKAKKPDRTPNHLKCECIWMEQDWRNSDREIADRTRMSPVTVSIVRRKFRNTAWPRIYKASKMAGVNVERFEPFREKYRKPEKPKASPLPFIKPEPTALDGSEPVYSTSVQGSVPETPSGSGPPAQPPS